MARRAAGTGECGGTPRVAPFRRAVRGDGTVGAEAGELAVAMKRELLDGGSDAEESPTKRARGIKQESAGFLVIKKQEPEEGVARSAGGEPVRKRMHMLKQESAKDSEEGDDDEVRCAGKARRRLTRKTSAESAAVKSEDEDGREASPSGTLKNEELKVENAHVKGEHAEVNTELLKSEDMQVKSDSYKVNTELLKSEDMQVKSDSYKAEDSGVKSDPGGVKLDADELKDELVKVKSKVEKQEEAAFFRTAPRAKVEPDEERPSLSPPKPRALRLRDFEDDHGKYCEDVNLYKVAERPSSQSCDVPGLAYHGTKDAEDASIAPEKYAAWGSLVMGVDEGDGWISTAGGYLPLLAEGGAQAVELVADPLLAMTFEEFLELNEAFGRLLEDVVVRETCGSIWAKHPHRLLRILRAKGYYLRLSKEASTGNVGAANIGTWAKVNSDVEEVLAASRTARLPKWDDRRRTQAAGQLVRVRGVDEGPGFYRVLHKVDVMVRVANDDFEEEAAVAEVRAGEVIEVVEVVTSSASKVVRGRMQQPMGWVDIFDLASGFRSAVKVDGGLERSVVCELRPTDALASRIVVLPKAALSKVPALPLRSVIDAPLGAVLTLTPDAHVLLDVCRARGRQHLHGGTALLASLGKTAQAIGKDSSENMLLCEVDSLGTLWLPIELLSVAQAATPLTPGGAEAADEEPQRMTSVAVEAKQGEPIATDGAAPILEQHLCQAATAPQWIGQCVRFRRSSRPQSAGRGCCLPCFFLPHFPWAAADDARASSACLRKLIANAAGARAFWRFLEEQRSGEDMPKEDLRSAFLQPEVCLAELGTSSADHLAPWPFADTAPAPRGPWGCAAGSCKTTGDSSLAGCVGDSIRSSDPAVFEARGAGEADPAAGAPEAPEETPAAPAPTPQLDGHVEPAQGAPVKRIVRRIAARQSGQPGVSWCEAKLNWYCGFHDACTGKRTYKNFMARHYLAPGGDLEAAIEAARRAAVAHARDLVRRGVVKEPGRRRAAAYRSDVPGVCWAGDAWKVKVSTGAGLVQKYFRVRGVASLAEIERQRLAAEASRRELEKQHGICFVTAQVRRAADMKNYTSGHAGVIWSASEQKWLVQPRVAGRRRLFRVSPVDTTEAAIETARLQAIRLCEELKAGVRT